jgi:hypothetical protein
MSSTFPHPFGLINAHNCRRWDEKVFREQTQLKQSKNNYHHHPRIDAKVKVIRRQVGLSGVVCLAVQLVWALSAINGYNFTPLSNDDPLQGPAGCAIPSFLALGASVLLSFRVSCWRFSFFLILS